MTQIDRVGKIVLGDTDLKGLHVFFDLAIKRPHAYKVAMARRCYNLFNVMKGNDRKSNIYGVITDNALQLYADDFAESYISVGRFPSVLLIDDILLYGRAIYNALYRMEDLVYEAVLSRDKDVKRLEIHRKMLQSTDIMVYAMSNVNDMIESSYLFKISHTKRCYGSSMIQLSRNISRFLNYCGEANTDHLLSSRIDAEALESLVARVDHESIAYAAWDYKGNHDQALFFEGDGIKSRSVHMFRRALDGDSVIWATGFPCVKYADNQSLEINCNKLASALTKCNKAKKLRNLLTSHIAGYAGYKMSLMSFFDSAATLLGLSQKLGKRWEATLKSSDVRRICNNFGKDEDVQDAVLFVLQDASLLQETSRRFREDSECIRISNPENEGADAVDFTQAENVLCRVGMASEEEAYNFSHNLRAFRPLSEECGKISIGDYLREMNADRYVVDWKVVANEMSMFRYGINSMKYDLDRTQPSRGISCYLKAGELSTHTFPQRHKGMLPALVRIESTAIAHSMSPTRLIGEYVKYLHDGFEQGSTNDLQTSGRYKQLFEDFEANYEWYLDQTYRCGKDLARWSEVYWDDYDSNSKGFASSDHIRYSSILFHKARNFLSQYLRQAYAYMPAKQSKA